MANPQSIIALVSILCAPVLSACESDEVGKLMADLTNTRSQYDLNQKAYNDLAATQGKTEEELSALRAQYASLAGIPPQQPQTPATDVPSHVPGPISERDLPCNEYEGEFRVWHCESGWRVYP